MTKLNPDPLDLLVGKKEYTLLKDLLTTMPDVILNDRQISDFEMLATGAFHPLSGFMGQINYESVLTGCAWNQENSGPFPSVWM